MRQIYINVNVQSCAQPYFVSDLVIKKVGKLDICTSQSS